jgi:CheY-like chemotaxis protein
MWEKQSEMKKCKDDGLHLSKPLMNNSWVSLSKSALHVPSVQHHRYRILCVDDDVLGTVLRAEILKEHGYSVAVYHCPFAAMRCDLFKVNLAILDFEMPGLNGRELFLRIRAMGARFPIVLLTGCLEALSHEDRVLFARCIDKGMPMHYLLDTIAEYLDPNQVADYGS